MKSLKCVLVHLLAIGLFGSIQAQSKQNSVSKGLLHEFQTKTEKWMLAYNSGDANNLIPLYAPDARYLSGHVNGLEAVGRNNVITNFQKGMSGRGHIDSLEIISSEISGDMAALITKYQATNSGTTVVGRNLLVLKKIGGNWVIVYHMTVV